MDNLIYKEIKITLLLCKEKIRNLIIYKLFIRILIVAQGLSWKRDNHKLLTISVLLKKKYGIFQSQDNTPYFQSVLKKRGVTIDKKTLGGNRNKNRPSEKEMGYGIVLERNVCHNVCRLVIIDRL